MSQTEQPNYYAIIPANVRYDKKLTPNAKLLYAEVTALCNMNGRCTASNQYFADLYGVSIRSIQQWISKLVELGYLSSEITYKAGTKEIESRVLFLPSVPGEEIITTPRKKLHDPHEENFIENNNPTDSNNIYNLDTSSLRSEVSSLTERINQIFEKYGLPIIRKMTAERLKKLRMRLVEAGGLDKFLEEIDKAFAASSFLRGENDRGWAADIDFLLRKSSFVRLLEGAYADKNSRNDDPEEFILGEHL